MMWIHPKRPSWCLDELIKWQACKSFWERSRGWQLWGHPLGRPAVKMTLDSKRQRIYSTCSQLISSISKMGEVRRLQKMSPATSPVSSQARTRNKTRRIAGLISLSPTHRYSCHPLAVIRRWNMSLVTLRWQKFRQIWANSAKTWA